MLGQARGDGVQGKVIAPGLAPPRAAGAAAAVNMFVLQPRPHYPRSPLLSHGDPLRPPRTCLATEILPTALIGQGSRQSSPHPSFHPSSLQHYPTPAPTPRSSSPAQLVGGRERFLAPCSLRRCWSPGCAGAGDVGPLHGVGY